MFRWATRNRTNREKREQEQREHIREVHRQHDSVYGSRKVYQVLRQRGIEIGHNRVARLMRREGLCGRWKPRRRPQSTFSRDAVYENVIQRRFSVTQPNALWLTDFTHIAVQNGTLHLAVVLDMYARRVVGWATSPVRADVAREAVFRALMRRTTQPGLVLHSDRGSEYTGSEMANLVQRYGIRRSFSAVGECYDNAPMESFFHLLKAEIGPLKRVRYETAHRTIARYIEQFYNELRIHSANGYRSPAQIEARYNYGTA